METSESPDPDHPFKCRLCGKRFTRQENLKRHAKLHLTASRKNPISCNTCPATFSRRDLYRRHLKNKHPELLNHSTGTGHEDDGSGRNGDGPSLGSETGSIERQEQDDRGASLGDLGPDGFESISRDETFLSMERAAPSVPVTDLLSFDNIHRPHEVESSHDTADYYMADNGFAHDFNVGSLPTVEAQPIRYGDSAVHTDISRGVDLFFENACHHYPFIHRPSFVVEASPRYLQLAMASLGYQYDDRSDAQDRSRSCFSSAMNLAEQYEKLVKDSVSKLQIVQTYLLLQACGMLYLGGDQAVDGGGLHYKMVALCRSNGLFQPSPMDPSATPDLDSMWRTFVHDESHKRTIFALHHMDAVWYQTLSVPRLLSHLEIKHDMPCLDAVWNIDSAAEWAHHKLLARHQTGEGAETMQYSQAIRYMFAVTDEDPAHYPHLGLQGVMSVIHFVLSSLREVSGWSTMTGSVSMERPEMLRKSLAALKHVFDGLPAATSRGRALIPATDERILVEATWRMAMLEMMSWNPSHMRGIVESTLEGAIATAAYVASTQELVIHPEIRQSLTRHLEWFLLYLDGTTDTTGESPLVALYAWRAFLIAWQLLQQESTVGPGCMDVIGIRAGDAGAARNWVRTVFGRRERWLIGRAVLRNVDGL